MKAKCGGSPKEGGKEVRIRVKLRGVNRLGPILSKKPINFFLSTKETNYFQICNLYYFFWANSNLY